MKYNTIYESSKLVVYAHGDSLVINTSFVEHIKGDTKITLYISKSNVMDFVIHVYDNYIQSHPGCEPTPTYHITNSTLDDGNISLDHTNIFNCYAKGDASYVDYVGCNIDSKTILGLTF